MYSPWLCKGDGGTLHDREMQVQLSLNHRLGFSKSHKQAGSLKSDLYVQAVLDAFLNINDNQCFYIVMF